ncbi:hypothetical protein HORIV_66780 [Vreelandella olivaria]|uniref:Uncharacterized protein n=1 Tax=Vreelandella olivaria TaxID=390919 RepID=A0ABM7GU03_9GAMM|nr:hypothetical protein HORIV_66780 [Halomonas olivaria]
MYIITGRIVKRTMAMTNSRDGVFNAINKEPLRYRLPKGYVKAESALNRLSLCEISGRR